MINLEQACSEGRDEGLQIAKQIRASISEGWPFGLFGLITEITYCMLHYVPDNFPILRYNPVIEAMTALFEWYKTDCDYIQQEWNKDKQRLRQARIQRDLLQTETEKWRAIAEEDNWPYEWVIATQLKRERNELLAALAERDTELAILCTALNTIPVHEYGEAQREGCDAKGAWDCFREALAEHVDAARSCPAAFAAKERLHTNAWCEGRESAAKFVEKYAPARWRRRGAAGIRSLHPTTHADDEEKE